ncbi:MAG: hypothetical protein IKO20_04185 [Bacteroidaceae bacterium]|nr:hypothetical protein [Bacteroidaceae bacterium]
MKTVSNIFNAIQGLNTVTTDIYGDFTVQAGAQEKAEDIRSEIRDYISADSLAAKILATATRFSEKQLRVIAYELDRNGYGKKLEEVTAAAAAREAYHKAAKSRRNAAKKQAKQAIEERAQANAAYTAGTEVEHAAFGKGVVKSNDGNTIVVAFENGEEKAFAAKFVRFA